MNEPNLTLHNLTYTNLFRSFLVKNSFFPNLLFRHFLVKKEIRFFFVDFDVFGPILFLFGASRPPQKKNGSPRVLHLRFI